MKKEIHPKNYRPVIFVDNASDERFLLHSTIETEEKGTWTDGEEYPLYRVEVSAASHPFYTGTDKVLDRAGRVEKFKMRAKQAVRTPKKKSSKVSE